MFSGNFIYMFHNLDSSKRRDRLRSKRRATYLKLQKAVDEYVQNHSELSHKDFDLATSMIFPWTGSEIKLSASPNLLKLFDAYHLYNRTVEELDILGAERKNLLEYAGIVILNFYFPKSVVLIFCCV